MNSLTPTLHYYKKVISTLVTLLTTQPCLHFVSSLVREHHAIEAPLAVVVPFHRRPTLIVPLHNDTYGDELADPLM
jgi:hypothetical protein